MQQRQVVPRGSLVALITPMLHNGDVDYTGLTALVEHHIASGSDGLVVMGTTGESPTLPIDEHLNVVRHCIAASQGRIAIIGGTGSNCTRSAMATTAALADSGIIAGLSVVPYYNKPTQEGLFAHFKTISESSDLPLILYNVPGRTVADLTDETVARLAELPGIVGLKDATGDLSRLSHLQQLISDPEFFFWSGDDATGCDFMLQGGHGVISVTANVAAAKMKQMCDMALQGDEAGARQLDVQLAGLHDKLFVEANPIPAKWACFQLGLTGTPMTRLPLLPLSQSYHQDVLDAMQQAGLSSVPVVNR